MATVAPIPVEARNVLYGIPWNTYMELRENPENYHLRMTYDRGTLEIMAPSPAHERYGIIIAKVIDVWTEELNIPICCLGEMTCKREDIEKGFEPDKCFYVQNEPQMWQKMEIDLTIDPPPDLAIEIEMTRSTIKKITSIYAAFGVPEVWRFDGNKLQAYALIEGGYRLLESSSCFPGLPLEKVEELAGQVGQVREIALIRGFRHWVRETFGQERKS
ncbi:MAG: Uma2 family endonuclease [Thermoguttaceae bacterium]